MRHKLMSQLTLMAALLSVAAASHSQVALEQLASGTGTPVAIAHAGDDRLFIVDRAGRVLIYRNGALSPQPFLDIRARVRAGGEQGLLSIAFHPNFENNGRLFANYTESSGATVVARFERSASPDRADAGSERRLLTIAQPFGNHNGGQLQFGPDGYLYIGMGDGGSANDPQCRAQSATSLLGKMLRIDVDQNDGSAPFHGIPVDNPFVGSANAPDEVWALGLRNPWRFSFDRETGDLYIGDVGQNEIEEIDFEPAGSAGGRNYGWKVMEGSRCFSTSACTASVPSCNSPALTLPILEYNHSQGCSVTGGYLYRGSEVGELAGRYVYGDFCSRTVWAAERQGGRWSSSEVLVAPGEITTFGEDARGELYLATERGRVYRFTGTPLQGPTGTLGFTETLVSVLESDLTATVEVSRTGGSSGPATVDFTTVERTAIAGIDFIETSGSLAWGDGDSSTHTLEIPLVDDSGFEPDELFRVRLTNASGAGLGDDIASVVLQDDDPSSFTCVPDPTTLCLNQGRFQARTRWRTSQGTAGDGQAAMLTPETGTFWFFDPDNVEVLVKVLDACSPFGAYWVFSAGLTDIEVVLEVTDSQSGRSRIYLNPQNTPFRPLQDVTAFSDCPAAAPKSR